MVVELFIKIILHSNKCGHFLLQFAAVCPTRALSAGAHMPDARALRRRALARTCPYARARYVKWPGARARSAKRPHTRARSAEKPVAPAHSAESPEARACSAHRPDAPARPAPPVHPVTRIAAQQSPRFSLPNRPPILTFM